MSIYIQEVLGLLKRNKKKIKLDKMRDHFEFGKLYHNSILNTGSVYSPKMEPFVIKWGDFICEATEDLTRTQPGSGNLGFVPMYTDPEGSCSWDTLKDSIITQNAIGDKITIGGDLKVDLDIILPNIHSKIIIGDDFQIYSDSGNNARISDIGTGILKLSSNNEVRISSSTSGDVYARFVENDAVILYHDNIKKFETIAGGIDVSGYLLLGSGATNIRILHNGNDAYYENYNGATYFMGAGGGSSQIYITLDNTTNRRVGIGTTNPNAKLEVDGGIQIANDADAASALKVGTFRYRKSGNNSYVEMCMQTGASSYVWHVIQTYTW
jgi:hypothetical protein